MRNTAELICGTEKNLVKEALIVTGPDELVTAADPVIEKLDDELRALEIRHKSEHRTAESAGWIGWYDKPSGKQI